MAEIKEVTPEEVKQTMDEPNTVIIDVREDQEVEQGMIEGAKHIPLGDIPNEADNLDNSKDYVLVCRSGKRSMNAAKYLNEQGFKTANMTGGMLKWDGEVII